MATSLPAIGFYGVSNSVFGATPKLTKAQEPPEFKEGMLYDYNGRVWEAKPYPKTGGRALSSVVHKDWISWNAVNLLTGIVLHPYQVGQKLRLKPEHHDYFKRAGGMEKWFAAGAEIELMSLYYNGRVWKVYAHYGDGCAHIWFCAEKTDMLAVPDLTWFTHIATSAPTVRPRNTTCNCGSPAFQCFQTVECESPKCKWYKS